MYKRQVTVRHILKEGEILSLALEDKEEDTSPYIIPVDIPIEILYSDKDLTACLLYTSAKYETGTFAGNSIIKSIDGIAETSDEFWQFLLDGEEVEARYGARCV